MSKEKNETKKLTDEEKAYQKNVRTLVHLLTLQNVKTSTKTVKRALEAMEADPADLLVKGNLKGLTEALKALPKSNGNKKNLEVYEELLQAWERNKKFPAVQDLIYSAVAKAIARSAKKKLTDEEKENIRNCLENHPDKIRKVLGLPEPEAKPNKKNKK